jgi:hypothetical protein
MPLRAIFHLSYRSTRRADDTLIAKLLGVAGVCRKTELGAELDAILRQGMSDCRDLFVLRGVRRPKRMTVLRLAARSIGQDQEQAGRLEGISPGQAEVLLRAVCLLMDTIGRTGFPPKSVSDAPVREAAPALKPVVIEPEALAFAAAEIGIIGLKEANRALRQEKAVPAARRRVRGLMSGDRRASVRPCPAAPALMAA